MFLTKAIAAAIFISVWVAIAAAGYLVLAAGYSFWVGAATVFAILFLINGSLAYRFRARQLRQQGKEPPSLLVFLFYPIPINLREPVTVARPFRVLLGIVIFIGGACVALAGAAILFKLDYSKIAHPVGAGIALLFLTSVGVGSTYVGIRLMVMKDDEPMLKWRKSNATKPSNIGAA